MDKLESNRLTFISHIRIITQDLNSIQDSLINAGFLPEGISRPASKSFVS